jgi:DNA repair protein RadC
VSIHEGHRKRIRELFLRGGLDVLNDHQVLELLLFYTNPRTDVNPIAHRLMETFGTLAAVLDAPYEELLKVEGVGENTAVFCKLLPQLMGRYQQSQDGRREIINSVQRAGEVIRKCFVGQTEEVVYLHCLDAKGKVLGRRLICRGSVNSASVSPRKLVETAMAFNASGVILSHNHTSGLALPSQEDIETTRRIGKALAAVEISLIDHIIVADDDFVSLANCGYIDQE